MPPRSAYSFGPERRLKKQAEFDAVYAAKAVKRAGPLRVHGLPNPAGRYRLGLSIGSRVGNAVVRNRIKRMLREAFRLTQHQWSGGYDLVVVAYAHEAAPLKQYQQWLAEAVEQIHRHWTKRQKESQP